MHCDRSESAHEVSVARSSNFGLNFPAICRYVWLLDGLIIRQVVLETRPHELRTETAEIARDAFELQLSRKNFGSSISCSAEKLHWNGTRIFPDDTIASDIKVLRVEMAPVVLEIALQPRGFLILVEAYPPADEVGLVFSFADAAEIVKCSDSGGECNVSPGWVPVNATSYIGGSTAEMWYDLSIEGVPIGGGNVTLTFANMHGAAPAGPIPLAASTNHTVGGVGGIGGGDDGSEAEEDKASMMLVSLVSVPVLLLLAGLAFYLYLRTPGSGIFKCGEYVVANDIWETEV